MKPDYQWVQGDHETVERDLATLTGAPDSLDLAGRTVEFVLRHYSGALVAESEATIEGTTATVELDSDALARTGSHTAEWRITGGVDDPTTLPSDGTITVDVRRAVHAPGEPLAPLREDATVDELTATSAVIERRLVGPSVATVDDLPDAEESAENQVLFVDDEQRYYRFAAEEA